MLGCLMFQLGLLQLELCGADCKFKSAKFQIRQFIISGVDCINRPWIAWINCLIDWSYKTGVPSATPSSDGKSAIAPAPSLKQKPSVGNTISFFSHGFESRERSVTLPKDLLNCQGVFGSNFANIELGIPGESMKLENSDGHSFPAVIAEAGSLKKSDCHSFCGNGTVSERLSPGAPPTPCAPRPTGSPSGCWRSGPLRRCSGQASTGSGQLRPWIRVRGRQAQDGPGRGAAR